MTDPIADMITRIKNALQVNKSEVVIPFSNLKENIAEILKQEKLIAGYKTVEKKNKKNLVISLRYEDNSSVISEMKRISKPGRRFYINKKEIYQFQKGFGFLILSTPKGVMTDKNAIKNGVGGELICRIW